MTNLTISFDYSTLPTDVASDAKIAADAFRRFERRTLEQAVEVGQLLMSVRGRLDHGQFVKWVEAEFGSKSAAYRCISLAENLDPAILPTLGGIGLTSAYALAAPNTPAEIRQEIVDLVANGSDIDSAMIKERIREARKAEKRAKADAKLTKEQRDRRRRSEERRIREWEKERLQKEARDEEEEHHALAAAKMVAERFGEELPEFLDHVKKSNGRRLLEALSALCAGPVTAAVIERVRTDVSVAALEG